MSIFVQATDAGKPKTQNVKTIGLLYAIAILVFAVSQLFTFEGFLTLLDSFGLPGGSSTAQVLAAVIVIAEVFALPFLLRMRLSPAMRVVSMVCGWLVALVWLALSLWVMLTVNAISNIGFLGDVIPLVPGWWTVFFSAALGILAAWASWGMWPLARTK
jgi:heme/copper-type cytochrome/quinol oxidase subunit 4